MTIRLVSILSVLLISQWPVHHARADGIVLRSAARFALPFLPADATGGRNIEEERGNLESICNGYDDSQHVEFYDGQLGPTKPFVANEEPSTGQLQWLDDLHSRFSDPNDSPGNVNGARWCSGTLIQRGDHDLFLTAAHCVRVQEGVKTSALTPRRDSHWVQPAELVKLMKVNFNYQKANPGGQVRVPDVYPIQSLVELGDEQASVQGIKLDYAVLRLGRNAEGQLPSAKYAPADLDSSSGARDGATLLTIIQHPHGKPKYVEAGSDIRSPRDVLLRYADLDTLGGSSGSGIIDQNGKVIGVHTNGGCESLSGYNYGVSLRAISQVSAIVK